MLTGTFRIDSKPGNHQKKKKRLEMTVYPHPYYSAIKNMKHM